MARSKTGLIETHIRNMQEVLHTQGRRKYDGHLKRWVRELLQFSLVFDNSDQAIYLGELPLLEKYDPEIKDFEKSLRDIIIPGIERRQVRQLMHFNNVNFDQRKQCISLVQFLPINDPDEDYMMIVYQRSGDISKFTDDVRFFSELAYRFFQKTRYQVSLINVIYGSFHGQFKP